MTEPFAINEILVTSAALIAITNPIGSAPIFLTLTRGESRANRRRGMIKVCLVVLTIMIGAAAFGSFAIELFGISLDALRVAGGIVIVSMGLNMVLGGDNPANRNDSSRPADDNLVVPFAMPIVAGPGTIATAITLATPDESKAPIAKYAALFLKVGIASMITTLVLAICIIIVVLLEKRISTRLIAIVTRFMGLVLVSIGVQLGVIGIVGLVRSVPVAG